MSNIRVEKKRTQRNYKNQFNEIKKYMVQQEEAMDALKTQIESQQDILRLYYEEYQALKRRNERQHLMTYIHMRESMLKDMAWYEAKNETNTKGYELLCMYVNQYTEMLEDYGVEIVECNMGNCFNAEIQNPIKRVDVAETENDNVVCEVYGSGYRWNGIVLKKMDVAVCICK